MDQAERRLDGVHGADLLGRLELEDAVVGQPGGATLTLTNALLPRWRDTAAGGHADDDLSAVYLTT